MTDISLKQAKQIPPHMLLRMINKAKKHLKGDETMQKICEEYGETTDIIDFFPVMFGDIDTSAKTVHGVVILSYKLLCNGDFKGWTSYLIHEFRHVFQQSFGEKGTKSSNDEDYLDNPHEQEAFTDQVEYISNHFGDNEAEKYVDNLLEHHDVENKKEYEDKKEILMSRV